MSNEDTVLKEAYSSFSQRLSFNDFQNKINLKTLGTDKWNFARAVQQFQEAIKYEESNPDLEIALLCSCAEALQLEKTSLKRFKEFYLRYCPSNLRTSPIKYYPNGKVPEITAPFGKALEFIYRQLRSVYIHEGTEHLKPEPIRNGIFGDVIRNKDGTKDFYFFDKMKTLEWFRQITFESLYVMLTK
ncbi:MAG: hypothetical protein ABSC20_11615 [Candidatus Bathyarchaeia archaeon]